MAKNFYDTERALSEYLLFHYGMTPRLLPAGMPDCGALDFPVRCVTECLEFDRLPKVGRALDLGCAVGGASFELARHFPEVVAIDFSRQFIGVARQLRAMGRLEFSYCVEGDITLGCRARVPAGIPRNRVRFQVGDAMRLPKGLGLFHVVLMANLIDRLSNPRECLKQLPDLIHKGGQLVITSPYTWLREYTPRKHWLGGFYKAGQPVRTLDTLKALLSADFRLIRRRNLPFLLREHSRKFQFSVAEATVWVRK